jgi:hypothetical protein
LIREIPGACAVPGRGAWDFPKRIVDPPHRIPELFLGFFAFRREVGAVDILGFGDDHCKLELSFRGLLRGERQNVGDLLLALAQPFGVVVQEIPPNRRAVPISCRIMYLLRTTPINSLALRPRLAARRTMSPEISLASVMNRSVSLRVSESGLRHSLLRRQGHARQFCAASFGHPNVQIIEADLVWRSVVETGAQRVPRSLSHRTKPPRER